MGEVQGNPDAVVIGSGPNGLVAASVLARAGFFLSLFLPRLAPLIFITAFFFQVGLYLSAGHPFFGHMVMLGILLVFITPWWWQALWDRYLAGSAPLISARPTVPR